MKRFRLFVCMTVLWLIALMMPPVGFAVEGKLVKDTIDSPSLEGNPLGDPATRNITIYLPPSYDKGGSFPVIYLLHGYTGDETVFVTEDIPYWKFFPTGTDFPANGFSGMLDDLIAVGKLKEMIVVMPDASNKYGGSHASTAYRWRAETEMMVNPVGSPDFVSINPSTQLIGINECGVTGADWVLGMHLTIRVSPTRALACGF